MRKFLIVLAVALCVLGAGAAVAEWYVRGRIVDGIVAQVEDATGHTPEVELDSFPVLLDLARGSIPGVDGTAETLAFDGIEFTDVAVRASDIRTSGATTITTLSGTAESGTIHGMALTAVVVDAAEIQLDPVTMESIDIAAETLTLGGVLFDDVTLRATNFVSQPEVTADLAIRAHLPNSTIEALVREQVGDDATVSLDDGVIYLGTEVLWQELSIGLQPDAVDGGLTLMPVSVSLGGLVVTVEDLPLGLDDQVQPFAVELPLGPLRLDAVEIVPTGILIDLSGVRVSPSDF